MKRRTDLNIKRGSPIDKIHENTLKNIDHRYLKKIRNKRYWFISDSLSTYNKKRLYLIKRIKDWKKRNKI